MPLDGDSKFKALKKSYAKGTELRGKTLGIIGLISLLIISIVIESSIVNSFNCYWVHCYLR